MIVLNDGPLRRVVSETNFSEIQKKRLDEKEQGYIIGYVIKRENEERNKKRFFKKPIDDIQTTDIIKASKTHNPRRKTK